MQYRKLGKTGWSVSAVSMGCWGIGGQWGPVEEAEALRTMQRAMDVGVNLLDTADSYGMGVSEERVGTAIRGRRNSVYVATKVGNFARRTGHPISFGSPQHVYLCADASLGRMKTDYIDLYQCHIGDLQEPEVFLEAFENLKERGKIRAYGISTNSLDVLRRFNQNDTCAAAQINYSMLNQAAARDILPYCHEHDIGTLIRGPLAQGLLAGKFSPETRFDDSVRASWNDGDGRERFLRNLEKVEQIRFLARPDRTLAQAALQFVVAHPAVTCAIPGAKNVGQAEANAAAADGPLAADELEKVRKISAGW